MSSVSWRPAFFGSRVVLLSAAHSLDAQVVSVGDRMRVQSEVRADASREGVGGRPGAKFSVTGILKRVTTDSLWLAESENGLISIPLSNVSKLEVSAGQRAQTLKGLAIGTGIGFGAGLLFGVTMCTVGGKDCDLETGGTGLAFGVLGAGVGLVIGTIAGASSSTDVWEEVTFRDLRVSVSASGLALKMPI